MKIIKISSAYDISDIELFLELSRSGVVVFRGYDMSEEEQLHLMRKVGEITRWYPNTSSQEYHSYVENHAETLKMRMSDDSNSIHGIGSDDILVAWHMEHIGFPNPAVGASWNMRKFTCSPKNGKTLFVDGAKLYEMLSVDDALFLEKCLFIENIQNELISKHPVLCPIRRNWLNTEKVVYLSPNSAGKYAEKLVYAQTFQPTDDERERFNQLTKMLIGEILNNQDIRIVHEWQQFDVLFADLSRMYHAVTGGFRPEERLFYGVWALGSKGDTFATP